MSTRSVVVSFLAISSLCLCSAVAVAEQGPPQIGVPGDDILDFYINVTPNGATEVGAPGGWYDARGLDQVLGVDVSSKRGIFTGEDANLWSGIFVAVDTDNLVSDSLVPLPSPLHHVGNIVGEEFLTGAQAMTEAEFLEDLVVMVGFDGRLDRGDIIVNAIPEPSTIAMLISASLLGLAMFRRRR